MADRDYTDIVDLTSYHLERDIQDELNYMYKIYNKHTTIDKEYKYGIIPVLPVHFAEMQSKWMKYLADICILWEYDDGSIVGYFYKGICKGKLLVIDPECYTVIAVFRNYKSFVSTFWDLARFPRSRSGDYPDMDESSGMWEVDHIISLQLCSMLESVFNDKTKRLLACLVTKIMPYQELGRLKDWTFSSDSYIQVSLFKSLRYCKYKDASEWLKSLQQQEDLTFEVRSEAQLTYDMICYMGTFKSPVTRRGKYIKFSNRTQYGDVIIRYEPIDEEEIQFTVEEGQSDVPPEFYNAIKAGVFAAIEHYKGFRLIGIRAVLIGGSTHYEANDMAYKIASSKSFMDALDEAIVIPIKQPKSLL